MKRKAARAIIINNGEFILIHRIREKEGKSIEYYVFPGGGLEENETFEMAVEREAFEELGIRVKPEKRMYRLEENDRDEIFILCQYLGGEVGTGQGPEFTSEAYSDRGQYLPEQVSFEKFKQIAVLEPIKKAIINDIESNGSLENSSFQDLSEKDFER